MCERLHVCLSVYRDDSTFVDIRDLDLGYMCQHNLVNDTDANKVIVEASVRATRSSNLTAGDTVSVTSAVLISDEVLAITLLNLTITDDFNETDHDVV